MRTMWCGLVVVLGACDAGAPSCTDAVAKAKSHGAGDYVAIVKVCEDKKWSGDLRGCLAKATSNVRADECLKPVANDVLEAKAEMAARLAADVDTNTVNILETELANYDNEIAAAIDVVINARTDRERADAQAVLQAVRGKKAEIEAKMAEARAALEKSERAKGVHISRECLANPLAKGCP